MQIAILTPSRARPERLVRFLNTVHTLSHNKTLIKSYNYVDSDDKFLDKYKELISPFKNTKLIIGPPQSVSKSWNVIAKEAIADGADILIMGNDDMQYRTLGWDQLLEIEVKKFPDKIFCMWFHDLINGEKHCAFPIVSKEWYQILGYFTPGVFNFGFNDTWIYHIALLIKRAHFIPYILNEHLHFSTGKMQADETTIRARKNASFQIDKEIFERTKPQREDDAKKLITYIKNHQESNII